MSNNNISNNNLTTINTSPIYNYWANAGFIPNMVAMYGGLFILSLAGFCLNILFVYLTKKSKSLHGRCNLLLAFNSLTITPLQLFSGVKFFVLFSGTNFIRLKTCYYFAFLPLIGAGLATSAQLCVGVDRLISVLFPFWYRDSDFYISTTILFIFCFVRCFVINCYYFYGVSLHPDNMVMCSTGDNVTPEAGPFVYDEGLVIFFTEFACYVTIWLIILIKKSSQEMANSKKLIKSLTILMGISVFIFLQASFSHLSTTFRRSPLMTQPLVKQLNEYLEL
uniref:G-protein coupled receptors family 1 profile domain-containing protein n=1 Tax=Meloidogyne incognita TaxID=6306 RepID=A0A914M5P6_MELIC